MMQANSLWLSCLKFQAVVSSSVSAELVRAHKNAEVAIHGRCVPRSCCLERSDAASCELRIEFENNAPA